MPTYRTPGVYIEEISVSPSSVTEVETAIPAFVGYTEKADMVVAGDLLWKPTLIRSFSEFEQYFGGPEPLDIAVSITPYRPVVVTPPTLKHNLAYNMKMFFDNGGGKCYVVSVGGFATAVAYGDLAEGLNRIAQEDEPTLIVIPEAVLLDGADYAKLVTAVLTQCGTLQDRFGIFDIREGDKVLGSTELRANRAHFGTENLRYGAAYYPFLKTMLNHLVKNDESNVQVTVNGSATALLGALRTTDMVSYNAAKAVLKDQFVVLPPSAAVAGVYATIDRTRGVWKTPANVSLAGVIEPLVRLDNNTQADLNVDAASGKSINGIRAFAGKGTLVWAARTLAGNDNEWRYIPVRRFFNMVEESVKKSTNWAVFEPNEAKTWDKVRAMIENYLTTKWRDGALLGATTKEAFFVRCGLGLTMTAHDILEGRMIVEIGMAAVRPAEFIILRFSHTLKIS